MNDKDEPRRLFESDDAPAGLRTLLVRAHEDVPSDATVAELLGRVERQAPPPRPSARWASSHATKLVLAVALVGAGGAVWWVTRDRAPARFVASPPEMPLLQQEPAQKAAMEAPVPPIPSDEQEAAPATVLPPRTVKRAPHAGRGRDVGETEAAVSTGAGSASAEEYALLRSARRALADDPARALQLTNEHLRRFSHGMLVQEREAIAVEALVRSGRASDAKVRAQAFFASFPDSPYRGRVERAVSSIAPAGSP